MNRLIRRILLTIAVIMTMTVFSLYFFLKYYTPPLSKNYGKVDAQLFLSNSSNQPLIVAFGGSQGGNTWTTDYWAEMRNKLLENGYAVLSIGYFNTENSPADLDRISLNAIYDTIKKSSRHPKIDADKIALLGSSRGGELVLNIASKFDDMDAVVALVPSHVTFPAGTITANTSAWNFNNEEMPYLPIPFNAAMANLFGNSDRAWGIILEGERNAKKSIIEVEKINGPILLLSAKDDKIWPSQYMSEKIVARLKENQFRYYYKHFSFDGDHFDTKKHFNEVFMFLEEHFKKDVNRSQLK